MALCLVLFITSLAIVSPVAHTEQFSLKSSWLCTDGTDASWTGYEEGDTAILLCVGQETSFNRPFDSIEIHWLSWPGHDDDDWVTVADHENIVYFDRRDRFSRPNLTVNGKNETVYRMAISPIDRYDGRTPRFGCHFGFSSGSSGRTARSVGVSWNPPSATCSASILPDSKAKKGDDVSRYCNVTDVDRLSHGSVTLWNGDVKLAVDETKTPLTPHGYEYGINYTNSVTDDTAHFVYTCRYSATGGFEEYESNCTFNQPLCVVDDLADLCPSSATGPRRFMMSSVYIGILVMVSSRIIVI